MTSFNFNSINSALNESNDSKNGVDFSGKSLKLDSKEDAKDIVEAINKCGNLTFLTLTGNTLGVIAAAAIAEALEKHSEFKIAKWSDMFTGRMKTEIPPALNALGNGMITAGARLSVLDLSDNAFGPIGVEGLAALLTSAVCGQLQELRLNNNGLGITGGKLLASSLLKASPPRLKVFIAGRNRLENEGAKALAEVFKRMGSLEEIAMPQNGIYHVGITALSEAFQHNPKLRSLNLNDNTIGLKGAVSIANALSALKNLKDINFGDCLLKSKGAKALARAFVDNSLQLECLDLSNNEIGREACKELVDCITSLPDSASRLTKVVLAGNSFGGAANKNALKEKLGDCAELSEGENSDDEYLTGSEETEGEEEEDDDDDDNESGTADVNLCFNSDANNSNEDEALDDSGVAESESDVERFIKNPSRRNFDRLGPNVAAVIDEHFSRQRPLPEQLVPYAAAWLGVSGLGGPGAPRLLPNLLAYAEGLGAAKWALASALLQGLSLIKSENKAYRIVWDLPNCYKVLSLEIDSPYFPENLRETIKLFIRNKREELIQLHEIPLDNYPNLC